MSNLSYDNKKLMSTLKTDQKNPYKIILYSLNNIYHYEYTKLLKYFRLKIFSKKKLRGQFHMNPLLELSNTARTFVQTCIYIFKKPSINIHLV